MRQGRNIEHSFSNLQLFISRASRRDDVPYFQLLLVASQCLKSGLVAWPFCYPRIYVGADCVWRAVVDMLSLGPARHFSTKILYRSPRHGLV